MHKCVDSGGRRVEGEPEDFESARGGPGRRSAIVEGGKVLSQCGKKHVPPLIAGVWWLFAEQCGSHINWLVAMLLEELSDKPPPQLVVVRPGEMS